MIRIANSNSATSLSLPNSKAKKGVNISDTLVSAIIIAFAIIAGAGIIGYGIRIQIGDYLAEIRNLLLKKK